MKRITCERCSKEVLVHPNARYCRDCGRNSNSTAEMNAAYQSGDHGRVAEILLSRTRLDGSCRVWTHATNAEGYANVTIGGRRCMAHRVMAEMALKVPSIGQTSIHHKCANRACIEPSHLFWVTPQENNAEMVERNFYLKRIADLEAQVEDLKNQVEQLTDP